MNVWNVFSLRYFSLNPEHSEEKVGSANNQDSPALKEKDTSKRGETDTGYLTGPFQSNPAISAKQAPRVFLHTCNGEARRLLVFKYFRITFFIVIDDDVSTIKPDFYVMMKQQLQQDLAKLDTALSRQEQRITQTTSNYRFLYFNAFNLALKTSLNRDPNSPMSMDTIKLIRKIHEDFQAKEDTTLNEKWAKIKADTKERKSAAKQKNNFATDLKTENEKKLQRKEIRKGVWVMTSYGRGRVAETRNEDHVCTVELGWKLAGGDWAKAYINWKNLSEITSDADDKKTSAQNAVPVSELLMDEAGQASDDEAYDTSVRAPVHVAVKTQNDGWLVASKATQTAREFFVLIDDKNGNLSSIQEEVNRLARVYFAKIFMH